MNYKLKKLEVMEEKKNFRKGGYEAITDGVQNDLNIAVKNITDLSVQNATELIEIDESEFESEIDPKLREEIEQLKRQGVFIPTDKFTILLTSNDGSSIMAKKNVHKGNRSDIAIVYAYNDGSRSDEVIINNAELLTMVRGNFGRDDERDDENAVSEDKADIAAAKKALKKFEERLLPYWRFGINIPTHAIVQMICRIYNQLKEDRSESPDIYNIYSYIIKKVESDRNHPGYSWIIRKRFYALPENYLEEIAVKFGLNTKELIMLLKHSNLLYLQDSSIGYQCKVKDIGYCYCVRMPKSRMGKYEAVDLSK